MSARRPDVPAVLLTIAALVGFAANSLLCRAALGGRAIDAASFTTVRLLSGALFLVLLSLGRGERVSWRDGSALNAVILFVYALAFSYAYLSLGASTGALLLFAAVQATMIARGLREGERPHLLEWTGLAMALAGLVYLLSPGLQAPPALGSALMLAAGVAWGLYSLQGRKSGDPLAATRGNFARAAPAALLVSLATWPTRHVSAAGLSLAALSGAAASGLGYVFWYAALPRLTAVRAALVQLSVPVLAALGAVLFLSESLSWRFALASAVVLGGVALAVRGRAAPARSSGPRLP
jgi:drug/metabolite transporter (DMT)-like permease